MIDNCTFADNLSYGGGGARFAWNSLVNLRKSLFYHNDAYYGAAIYCYYGSEITMDRCTIIDNGWDNAYCGGIQCLLTPNLTVINSVIANNNAPGMVFGTSSQNAQVLHCNFYNNASGNFTGDPPSQLGEIVTVNANGDSSDVFYNVFLDPAFVDTSQNDFRIGWRSPCIDAGDPNPLYNDPDSTVADMGCFFYDQSVPVRVLLTPHGAPITIPGAGGSFDYTIRLTSIDPSIPSFDVWCDVTLPDGSIYGPVLGPVTSALDSGLTVSRERTQIVPGGVLAGVYTYNAYAVVGVDTSMDSFPIYKAEPVDGRGTAGWSNRGEAFDGIEPSPASSGLLFCYPNPFNPVTTVSFNLPVSAKVKLDVFDISGRKVAILMDGWLNQGFHRTTFNASHLPSGVYFTRLTGEGIADTQKVLFIK